MTQRSQRQCSVEMAKWKNALVMYDPIVPVVVTINSDYEDCIPAKSVLSVNDRTVGNVATGLVSSAINQASSALVVRDALLEMRAYSRFIERALW